jgi:hypothetical protein
MTQQEMARRAALLAHSKQWAQQQQQSMFESLSVKLGEGVQAYKLAIGTHRVDFMGFKAGPDNPGADPGFAHFDRVYYAHRLPVSGRSQLVTCPWFSFQKRPPAKRKCPVCEFCNMVDKKRAEGMWASQKHLWLVNDQPGIADNPLKVLDTGHKNRGQGFGEMILDVVNISDDNALFWHPEFGMTVQMVVKEQTMGNGIKYNAVTRFDFLPRDYAYDENFEDESRWFTIIESTYEQLHDLVHGTATAAPTGQTSQAPPQNGQNPPQAATGTAARPKATTGVKTPPSAGPGPATAPGQQALENHLAGDVREWNVGDVVAFNYRGDDLSGPITEINRPRKLAKVQVEGRAQPCVMGWADLVEVTTDPLPEPEPEPPADEWSSEPAAVPAATQPPPADDWEMAAAPEPAPAAKAGKGRGKVAVAPAEVTPQQEADLWDSDAPAQAPTPPTTKKAAARKK